MDVAEITGAWDYATLPANVSVGRGCFLERKESFRRFLVKESNRVDAVVQTLGRMGAKVTARDDGFIVHGPAPALHGAPGKAVLDLAPPSSNMTDYL